MKNQVQIHSAMMHTKISILAVEHPYERHALRILTAILIALSCGYLYFVAASVLNVIAGREADTQSSKIQTSIGSLEENYLSLAQSLSPDSGIPLGLRPIANESYVYRPGNVSDARTSGTI